MGALGSCAATFIFAPTMMIGGVGQPVAAKTGSAPIHKTEDKKSPVDIARIHTRFIEHTSYSADNLTFRIGADQTKITLPPEREGPSF
jgi:hypothetical protein